MALNIGSSGGYLDYQKNTNALGNSMRQLSSGYRINSAGDDAAGLAVSESMRAQIASQKAQYQNAQNDISSARTGDGALSTVHDALGRMRELASQASGGVYTDSDRAMLQKEFSQLQSQISNVFESTNFNGSKLLDNNLDISQLNIGTQDGAMAALSGLSTAIDAVSSQRSDFGAAQTGAEYAASGLMNAMVNTQDAESEIRDLDIALAVMENTRKKILSQTNIAMMAQANQNAAGVLRLLQ